MLTQTASSTYGGRSSDVELTLNYYLTDKDFDIEPIETTTKNTEDAFT